MATSLDSSEIYEVLSEEPQAPIERMPKIEALALSFDALEAEFKSFKAEMKASLKELKTAAHGRDVLLNCLESAVTSSAEKLTSMRHQLEETLGTRTGPIPPPRTSADNMRECVEVMLGRTTILNRNEEKAYRVRGIYQWLYHQGDLTACLCKFFCKESRLTVMVDCDSLSIGRMKRRVKFDGIERSGFRFTSFADFTNHTLYLGAATSGSRDVKYFAGWLARSLAHMCLLLAFDNGGRPYERYDLVNENLFKRTLHNAVEEKGKRRIFHRYIELALEKPTALATEMEFVAVVPHIVGQYGPTEGTSTLQNQVPYLLDFYEYHVMSTLLQKSRGGVQP